MTIDGKVGDMLVVQGLCKQFGNFKAVDSVDLHVGVGEIFGFLGPNGAGKTTTIKMLAGLLKPDKGDVVIGGTRMTIDPEHCKQVTGYIPDRPYLYEKLTGLEFLHFCASLYKVSKENFTKNCDKYLGLFDLNEWRHNLIESYSHGMRQKLIITAAFLPEPPLIIVDEPMVGLDPKSARIVKSLFKEHAAQGGSVFLSTHSLDVAEELCDRIAIILNGKLKATGDIESLKKQAKTDVYGLEDIFLELTGVYELNDIVMALRSDK
jgi:ABC-2 type transport system ATP-binding protein